MYQVLYRKWRPKIFADVVGQPHVTTTLKNELKSSRIAHAYLFTGSRGTGKTTCAKILAKAINCLDLKDGDPCGECDNCKGIENGTIMDVVEIDAASNNGVDNIRDLREESSFTPSVAKYRVYIIDEVHMLSIGAFNALLKTLEEPPEHVVFILATTEVHKLPATILSRCQRFDFHRIDSSEIYKRLKYITEQEGKILNEDAGMLIASLSDGALRDALSLLDQCMGKAKNVITTEIVVQTAGLAGNEHLFQIVNLISEKNISQLISTIDELYMQSKDMGRLLEELTEHFRNMMLIKIMSAPRHMMVVTDDDYKKLEIQSKIFKLDDIISIMESLEDTLQKLNKGINAKTELELLMIKLCSPNLDEQINTLSKKIETLEKVIKNNDVPISKQTFLENSKVDTNCERKSNITSEKIQDKKEKVNSNVKVTNNKSNNDIWQQVLNELKPVSKILYTSLSKSKAVIEGNIAYIDGSPFTNSLLNQSEKRDILIKLLKDVTGKEEFTIKNWSEKSNQKLSNESTSILDKSQQETVLDNFISNIDDDDINIKID